MTSTSETTLGMLLVDHLSAAGIPPDGGDDEPFVVVKIALLPYPIPNTKGRKRAVKIHDLNHIVSGYATDRVGELEISAWELASGGCQRYMTAWLLDLAGLAGGLLFAPRRTFHAFQRGRGQQNLYRYKLKDLLAMPIEVARSATGEPERDRWRALPLSLHMAVLVGAAIPVMLVMSAAWYVLVPVWLLSRVRSSRSTRPLAT